MALLSRGADVSDRRMVWAHYVPWESPENHSLGVKKHYNFPVFSSPTSCPYRQEFEKAMEQGVEGFFVDVVVHPNGTVSYWDLREMLDSAMGTEFQIGFCLDVKTSVSNQVLAINKMLDAYGDHPNYPRWKDAYVVMTYTFRAWTPQEWREIRSGVESNGRKIFLIANLTTAYKEFKRDGVEKYLDVIDMAYNFNNGGLSGQDPAWIDAEIADVLSRRGKTFMGTVWPGYYGAWLNGRNDFYQPYCGVDRAMTGYLSARKLDTPWLHVTTWNDYDETAFAPRRLSTGTRALTKAFSKEIRRLPPAKETDVIFAYHREEFPGTLLRIEAMRLPSLERTPVLVSGVLNPAGLGAGVALAEKTLTGAWDRVEWLIPTTELSRFPALVPQLRMKCSDGRYKRGSFPAIHFVEPWYEDAETVRMTFGDVADVDGRLSVSYEQGKIVARMSFKSDKAIRRAVLFRNARPIGQFRSSDGRPQMNLQLAGKGTCALSVDKAKIVGANRLFACKGKSGFDWDSQRFTLKKVPKWAYAGLRVEGDEDSVVNLAVGKEKARITLGDLARARRMSVGAFTCEVACDLTLYDDEPLRGLMQSKGELVMRCVDRAPAYNDVFWVRYEFDDGVAAATAPIWPFAISSQPRLRNVVETAVTLEKSWGASGQPGRSEMLTPFDNLPVKRTKIVQTAVSPLIVRSAEWRKDALVNLKGDRALTRSKEHVKLPLRMWPSGNFDVVLKYRVSAIDGRPRKIIEKVGGMDGPELSLLSNGCLRVEYTYGGVKETDILRSGASGHLPVADGLYHEIRISGDCRKIRLLVDGVEDCCFDIEPIRTYGNLAVFLYGDWEWLRLN